jgi:16S rRNA (guanine1207-N2)-methyltransferase
MADGTKTGVYGAPPADLADVAADSIQFSPLMPGAASLEDLAEQSLDAITILAPPGTRERRYVLALALRAVKPGGALTALAPKDRGGARLRKELTDFGCDVRDEARGHHRIVTCARPAAPDIAAAIDDGNPRITGDLGVWSQPGVFSWDRLDPGSELLLEHLPHQSGRGADFGCGIGVLARAVLASPKVTELSLIDIDRRAVACAEHNVLDPRARFLWADVRKAELADLDFVVMNAPFHDAGIEDKTLAQSFVKRAAEVLHKGGVLWLVANRHLPYEAILTPLFKRAELVIETGGYKIYEARK